MRRITDISRSWRPAAAAAQPHRPIACNFAERNRAGLLCRGVLRGGLVRRGEGKRCLTHAACKESKRGIVSFFFRVYWGWNEFFSVAGVKGGTSVSFNDTESRYSFGGII